MCETCGHHAVHHRMWVGDCQTSGCSCSKYIHGSRQHRHEPGMTCWCGHAEPNLEEQP